jgi:hypothetical protein
MGTRSIVSGPGPAGTVNCNGRANENAHAAHEKGRADVEKLHAGRSTPASSLGNSLFAGQIAKTVQGMRRDLR